MSSFWFICSIKDVERIRSYKASTSPSAVKEKKQCMEIELLSFLLYFFWLCSYICIVQTDVFVYSQLHELTSLDVGIEHWKNYEEVGEGGQLAA